jgi:hypothetical protein
VLLVTGKTAWTGAADMGDTPPRWWLSRNQKCLALAFVAKVIDDLQAATFGRTYSALLACAS